MTSQSFTVSQSLFTWVFEQISVALQETARLSGQESIALTEADFTSSKTQPGTQRFLLALSPRFNGLLIGNGVPDAANSAQSVFTDLNDCAIAAPAESVYQVELQFDPMAISAFLNTLTTRPSSTHLLPRLEDVKVWLSSNDAALQSHFTLRLVDLLTQRKAIEPCLKDHDFLELEELESKYGNPTDSTLPVSLLKSEFIASISHELRTPLTAIIGMSATLLRLPLTAKREQLLSLEKQHAYLQIIRNSGEHLLELINDILDLTLVEAGKSALEVQEFSLSQVATECFRLLQSKAVQNGLKLRLDLKIESDQQSGSSRHPDRFIADARRVRQILLNLLSNAIKFTPAGGQITLHVWVEQENAIFQVEDTGIGIPEQQFPLLFKKFQQLDTSYHRQYGGTGLGLALTQQLVEMHGGQITVESTVGVGSVFTVCLPPQSLSTHGVPTGAIAPQLQRPQGRVVLIENDEQMATLICDLLTAAGHQVVWMIDGMTALQQVELLNPKVVIINSHLSGMSVAEILRQFHENKATHAIKVLVLIEKELEQQPWLTENAVDWLNMPTTHPEDLIAKVARLMAES